MPSIRARRRPMPAALVAVAIALLFVFAGTARAGTYDVTSCNPDGSAAGWAAYGSAAYQTGIVCPYNGDLTNRGFGVANYPSVGVLGYSGGGLMFKAPSGTSLAGIGGGLRVSRWDASYWLGLITASGQNLYGYWAHDGNGAPAGAYTAHSWFTLNRESDVHLEVGCSSPCDTALLPGTGRRVWAQMFDPITVRIEDDDAPVETLTGGGVLTSPYATGTQAVTYSATDASGIRATRLYVDGTKLRDDTRSCNFEQPVPCSNVSNASYSVDTRTLSDGAHTVKVETVDSAGNAASQSRSIVVDNGAPAPPTVAMVGGEGWRASNDFAASWTNPGGQAAPIVKAHYELCRADEPGSCQPAGAQTGTNLTSLSGLNLPAEGDYTLSVWLEDAAGNTSAANSSAPVHLRYDGSAPKQVRNLSISGGDSWHSSNSFDLNWENAPGQLAPITSVRYRICDSDGSCTTESQTGAAGVDALSSVRVPGAGDYELTLWVGDEAGNVSEASASSSVHLKFDDADPGDAELRPADRWLNATDVANGYDEHISLAGDGAPLSGVAGFAVSVDGSDPGATPDAGPDGLWHIGQLPEGTVVLKARAISNSGVTSSHIGSTVVSVDKTAPSASASGVPDPARWQSESVTLTLTGTDQPGLSGMAGGHLSYSIDGAPSETASGDSATVTVAADGRHTVTYAATDLAGNTSAEHNLSFKLDTTPPGDAALDDPGRWLNASDPERYVQRLGLADVDRAPLSGLAGYSITTDGEAPDATVETAGDSIDLGRLEDGTTVVKARAVSGSGLASAQATSVQIHVDRTPPEVSALRDPDADAWHGRAVSLELKGRDALSGMSGGRIAYRVDSGDEATVPGESTSVEVGSDGPHTIRYYAIDAAGNRSETKAASFKIDSEKPGAAVAESSDGWISRSGSYVEHIALGEGETLPSSGLAGFSVTTDGSAPDDTPDTDASGEFSIDDLQEGVTTVKARAISGAGVASDAVGVGTIKVDRTPPEASLDRPEGNALTAGVSDATSGVRSGLLEMRAAGAPAWTPLSTVLRDGKLAAALDLDRLAPGSYDLRATAIDAAGNRRAVTTFAGGGPATLVVRASASGLTGSEPTAATQTAPRTTAPKARPVRCSAKSKHTKRGRHHRRAGKRHRRAHKRQASRPCPKGGEKHHRRHLTRKTHKPARRTAG